MAVDAGMIGYTTTSTGTATVAAYGSRRPATANNALAWGVPTRSGAPFVLDMACAVSRGAKWKASSSTADNFRPVGLWMQPAIQRKTRGPPKRCSRLPVPAAMAWRFSRRCWPARSSVDGCRCTKAANVATDGSEHFFYAIDIRQFVDLDRFYSELESTMADIRDLPPADGFDRVRLPGELEWERARAGSARASPSTVIMSKNSRKSRPLSSCPSRGKPPDSGRG